MDRLTEEKPEDVDIIVIISLLSYIALDFLSLNFANAIAVSRDLISIPIHFEVMTSSDWLLVGLLMYITRKFPFTEDSLRIAADIIGLPGLLKSLEQILNNNVVSAKIVNRER